MKSNTILIIGSVLTVFLIFLWQYKIIEEPIAALGGAVVTLLSYMYANNKEKNIDTNSQNHNGKGDNVGRDKSTGQIITGGKADIKNYTNSGINAPNALIVTNEQSGGTNTVITNKVEPSLPRIIWSGWSIQNSKVNEIIDRFTRQKIITPFEKANQDFLYHNQIKITYISEFSRNEIGFRIKAIDILHGKIVKSGRVQSQIRGTNEGWFVFVLSQPENGIYTLDIYSKNPIDTIYDKIDYLK